MLLARKPKDLLALLCVLYLRYYHISNDGQISFDEDSKFNMRDLAQYVEQDDALIGVLTVRETVVFAAKLRYVTTLSLLIATDIVTACQEVFQRPKC